MDLNEARQRMSDPDALPSAASGALAPVRLPAMAFFASTWLILGAAGSSRMFQDPGVFWHLLTGDRILTLGFPREDWLTFTHAGKPWIAHQWLAEVAMAILRRAGGYDALLVIASGLLAWLFTLLLHRLVNRGVQQRWAILLTALAILVSAGSLHVRPLLLSMAFFACAFVRLVDVETGHARMPTLAWLVPLFVLWANCHGAVMGGIASIWLAALLWLGAWLVGRASPVRDRTDALTLALIILGAALAPLANPYGLELLRTWFAIMRSSAVSELIVEHASVRRTASWYVLPLAIVYLAVWASAGRARWRATSVLSLVWLALMLQRVRHAPLFAIAALLSLAELLPDSAAVEWLARRGVRLCGPASASRPLPSVLRVAPTVALVVACVHFQITGRSFGGPRRGAWPFELKPAIEAAVRAAGPGAPILNDMVLGGFLSYEVPQARIFGDDRCELYGDEFLRNWTTGSADWFARWVAEYDIRIAVARRGSAIDAYLRATPEWRLASSEASTTLFLRSTDESRARRP